MTRSPAVLAFLLLLLPGCLNRPPNMRPAEPSELAAVEALREQFIADGYQLGECAVFEDVYIAENPQEVTQNLCGYRAGSGVVACVMVVNVDIGDIPGSVLMFISGGVGWRSHHSLVIHEAAHVMTGCAGVYYGNRDHSSPVWRGHMPGQIGTEGRAWERWEALGTLVPDPDPYANAPTTEDAGP